MHSRRPPIAKTARARVDWLSRALARGGVMALADAEEAIRRGRVSVDGRTVHQPMTAVSPQSMVRLDGHRVVLERPFHVLMFHKPAGLVTAREDRHGEGTVFERLRSLLPYELQHFEWHAVGRLDRDTRGLLLFCNDERLVAHVTEPAHKVEKAYRAKVGAKVTADKIARLAEGMELEDGPTLPARALKLGRNELELVLTEGRNHQAKRMLGALGLPVTELIRVRVGKLELDIPEGQYRALSLDEVRDGLGYSAP